MNFTVADMLAGGISITKTFFHWGDTMIANFRNIPWIHTGVPFLTLCYLLVSSDISDKYFYDFSTASTRQVF